MTEQKAKKNGDCIILFGIIVDGKPLVELDRSGGGGCYYDRDEAIRVASERTRNDGHARLIAEIRYGIVSGPAQVQVL
jgi:hypothetical protein